VDLPVPPLAHDRRRILHCRIASPGIDALNGVGGRRQESAIAMCGGAFRRGLATNLHRLGDSDKVIQQILRHATVSTTMNIYVKTVTADAANVMKSLETMCATTVQPERLGSTRIM
jgi:hypothetical protein